MTTLKNILSFTNQYLQIDRFRDYCPNGLQVEGKQDINHIITGVSSSIELFQKAQEENGDLILVHHGLLWANKPAVIMGSFKRRIEFLLQYQLSLLAYHLPLDAHEEVGNNAILAGLFELQDIKSFAEYKGRKIGYIGTLAKETAFNSFLEKVKSVCQNELIYYPYGNPQVKRIGIVSGGAAAELQQAVDAECDVFITGEVNESTMHFAKEEGIHFIAGGHYNTEKFGIQRLGEKLAAEFNLKHSFIDIANPV